MSVAAAGRPGRRILMVAYHFPPLAGSSGIQRTLRFVQQLPDLGWQPLVLGAHPMAFEHCSTDLAAEVPEGTVVRRALALDTARHLSIGGRYLGALARPDRWMTWQFDAVRLGMAIIREFRPDVIWSTYPIATAHLIGAELQRRSGLPWVADFRDPMAQDGYPADPHVWRSFRQIEERAALHARLCTFTTPSAVATYRRRYPGAAARFELLENGYDESSFVRAEATEAPIADRAALNPGCVTLLHSGIVYPAERDPTQLVEALAQLRQRAPQLAARLRLRFRAAVHDDLLRDLAAQHGVSDLVELCPPVNYSAALAEMLRADGLLVMQAANCNEQVPAKVYEYLRAGRPIVCLSDPAGDTWGVLQAAGLSRLARLDNAAEITTLLGELADRGPQGVVPGLRPEPGRVALASRSARTALLAGWLEGLVGQLPASQTSAAP